jgi:hypothetical protein
MMADDKGSHPKHELRVEVESPKSIYSDTNETLLVMLIDMEMFWGLFYMQHCHPKN